VSVVPRSPGSKEVADGPNEVLETIARQQFPVSADPPRLARQAWGIGVMYPPTKPGFWVPTVNTPSKSPCVERSRPDEKCDDLTREAAS
jgi:hypothetical protein